jgi:acetylornithine/succinyldiaminopimelate/putrescine aminotransferase
MAVEQPVTPSLIDREHQRFIATYKRLPLEVDHAEGMYIVTRDRERYLDFLGGIAVNTLGHSHPAIISAVERQVRRYTHLSNYFYQDAQIEFAETLLDLAGYSRLFLTNSGAEATDAALKLARAYGSATGRTKIIGFTGGFHGRSYGALSIMDRPHYKDGMGPYLPEATVLPFNDVDALDAAVDETTCAIMLEFLQGEGGVHWAEEPFVRRIFELRAKHGFLVIADEVQAGCGRTGDFFSFERFGVRPDIVDVAKGVGGGLPLGAMLTDDTVCASWSAGRHGTTFGGNALACAAGTAVLHEVSGGLMQHAAEVGTYALQRLRQLADQFPSIITEVRGAGAMIGVQLSQPAAPIVEALLARRVIANATADTVLRLLPPLIFERSHVDELVSTLEEVLREQG